MEKEKEEKYIEKREKVTVKLSLVCYTRGIASQSISQSTKYYECVGEFISFG